MFVILISLSYNVYIGVGLTDDITRNPYGAGVRICSFNITHTFYFVLGQRSCCLCTSVWIKIYIHHVTVGNYSDNTVLMIFLKPNAHFGVVMYYKKATFTE